MLHSIPARRRTLAAFAASGVTVAVVAAMAATPAQADGDSHQPGNQFQQTNLVSDLNDQNAKIVDPDLRNSWGLAMGPSTPIWVADNASGLATLYSVTPGGTNAMKLGLVVTLPGGRASTSDGPSPTGQVFNGTSGFAINPATPGSPSARFIFDSEAGQITAWAGATGPQVEFSSPTAVYKGLAIATSDAGTFLYASNFHDGTVDVFDSSFHQVHLAGGFTDPTIPDGYAPFGIQALNGLIYVSYAKQNAQMHDDVAGEGHGFINVFTPNGFRVERLVSRGELNSPWGMTIAPAGFGRFGGALLVGNFGDGMIHAYDPFTGHFLGELRDPNGQAISIDGLWGLTFGTATTGGTGTLLFSAGINHEVDGLFGAINPVG